MLRLSLLVRVNMIKKRNSGSAVFVVLGLVLALVVTSGLYFLSEPKGTKYFRLTMQQADGTHKVFVGKSANTYQGIAYWTDLNQVPHRFTGPHWLDEISSQTFHDFKVKGEEMPVSKKTALFIKVGDIYEDCAYHPVLCTSVKGEDETNASVTGISLIDGSYGRTCSIPGCGVKKLTVAQAVKIKENWPAHSEEK